MCGLTIIFIMMSAAIGLIIKTGDDVTISGISSGAFMCMQMHIANSEIIRGAGIFGGGPYLCAKRSQNKSIQKGEGSKSSSKDDLEACPFMKKHHVAIMDCMLDGSGIDLTEIKKTIKDYEIQGKIDSTSNLIGDKVYIFSGTSDDLVVSKVLIKNNFLNIINIYKN